MPCWRRLLRVPQHRLRRQQARRRRRSARRVRARSRGADRLRRRGRLRRRRASCRSRRCTATTSAGRSAIADYDGPTLLALLERLPSESAIDGTTLVPVQYVGARAGDGVGHRSRVLWGRVARGAVAVGDELVVFPSGETARVAELHAAGGRVASVGADRSVGVVLDRQLDVSRGDWLATPGAVRADGALSRHARLARQRAGDRRPQVLAAPRQPLAAGPHHRDREPARHHDARGARRRRARRQRHRRGRGRDAAAAAARELRQRSRRRRAARRRSGDATGPAARCSSATCSPDERVARCARPRENRAAASVTSRVTSRCRSGRTRRRRRSASSAPWPSRRRPRRW